MAISRQTEPRYVFLDHLRALAAWLVVWDHLANVMPQGHGRVFPPAEFVRTRIADPLGAIQNFGWFGVTLFFLISGFIISDRARVERVGEFVIKRVLRIYPMLAIAVLLSAAFLAPRAQVKPSSVILNLTLLNYLITPQIALLGVAWTLVIEMVFYAMTAATQFARNSPHRIALNLVLIALVFWKAKAFGESFFLLAATATYLPILIMGQTLYWWLARRRLSDVWGLGYLGASYGLFIAGLQALQPGFLPASNSYPISVAYALLLFIVLMHAKLPERRWVRFLADTSYSMYLLHGLVGWWVLAMLIDRTPLGVAILAAAAASLLAAVVAYRLVERPAQRLARYLTREQA